MNFGPNSLRFLSYLLIGISVFILNVATYCQVSRKSKELFHRVSAISTDEGRKILEKERSVRKTVAMLTSAFFLVRFPYSILMKLDPTAAITRPSTFNLVVFILSSIVLIDPVVFIYSQKKYSEEFKIILRSIYCQVLKTTEQPYTQKRQQKIL